jgi:magnesium transporter
MLGHGPTAALFAVCDSVVDEYAAVAVELENDVVEVERSLFSPERSHDADRIYVLKREVLEVRRAWVPCASR